MPTQDFGVYPDSGTRGAEVSSTYEGRHVTLLASEINHGSGVAVVTKGYPVVFGTVAGNHGVGIPFKTEVAGTDLIPIDTEGIWNVQVVASDDNGGSLVTGGDPLYINTTTCVVSKIRNTATQIPFGYALGQVAAAATAVIAVKVHWDPSLDTNDQMFKTVTSGTYNYGKQWVGLLEAGESTGVAGYFAAQVDGQQTGGIYAGGAWMEPQAAFIANGSLLVGWDVGFYCANGAGQDMSLARMVGLQLMADIGENPASLHWLRVNAAATTGAITAVIAAANADSVGYLAVATEGDPPVGYVPMFDIVGVGVVYVRVYTDTD